MQYVLLTYSLTSQCIIVKIQLLRTAWILFIVCFVNWFYNARQIYIKVVFFCFTCYVTLYCSLSAVCFWDFSFFVREIYHHCTWLHYLQSSNGQVYLETDKYCFSSYESGRWSFEASLVFIFGMYKQETLN